MRILSFVVLATWAIGATGCAHTQKDGTSDDAARELLSEACEPGSQVKSAKGSVWLSARSQEAKGRFPAYVAAEGLDQLELQVTNLLGGTEAMITVKNGRYRISSPSKKVREEEGFGAWGGIPLNWATELFLGRIPCPSTDEMKTARVATNGEGALVVETQPSLKGEGERFVYTFRKWAGTPWPETLRWERKGPLGVAVDFKFDDPEDRTRSPRKWEARSSLGEVKVRWKERDIVI